jgi:hypothetical protein
LYLIKFKKNIKKDFIKKFIMLYTPIGVRYALSTIIIGLILNFFIHEAIVLDDVLSKTQIL